MTVTGRPDYDQTVRFATITPDEPRFIIRAGDAVGAEAVRGWAALAHRAGSPPEAIELALQQADAFDRWPSKKVPDGPDLSPDRRKQLGYEHSRRAWKAANLPYSPDFALGHRAGADAVLGRLRPLLGDLLTHLPAEGPGAAHATLAMLYGMVGQDLDARLAERAP